MPATTTTRAIIEAIHASPGMAALCICGAGSSAVSSLTAVPGCSRTLLQADTLYSRSALAAALRHRPHRAVSPSTARQLAQHAYTTAERLAPASARAAPLLGIGATSAVQTSRERHGGDRACVCVWGRPASAPPAGSTPGNVAGVVVSEYYLELPRHWDRAAQDAEVALLILQALYDHCGPSDAGDTLSLLSAETAPLLRRSSRPLFAAGSENANDGGDEEDASEAAHLEALVQLVLDGSTPYVLWNENGEVRSPLEPFGVEEDSEANDEDDAARPLRLLYPGSFRPLHWGHTELARAAAEVAATDGGSSGERHPTLDAALDHVTFEISANIVDKGAVTARAMAQRVRPFLRRRLRVAVTSATLFVDKAKLFPRHGFVCGSDTATRILDPKYYPGGDEAGLVAALTTGFADAGCYFVVGGRRLGDGSWEDLSSISVPPPLQGLFLNVPESKFRVDISSTELRARAGIQ